MPAIRHEGAVMLVRDRPELVLDLLRRVSAWVPLDGGSVVVENADFSQAIPLERRADLAFVLDRAGVKQAAFVVEVQLDIDDEKRFAWPLYAASLHARARCSTQLVVIAGSRRVAAWAREPALTIAGFAPIVLGPDEVPRVEDYEDATRSPELTFLSALIHGRGRAGQRILETALRVAQSLDEARAAHYVDLVYSAHPIAARAAMEVVMTIHGREFKSDFMRKLNAEGRAEGHAQGVAQGIAEGRAQGARDAIKALLSARGIDLSEAGLERIAQCSEAGALERWVVRAAIATTEQELFADL